MKKSGVGSRVTCENSGSFGCHETDENTRILYVERVWSNCEYLVLDIARDLAATKTKIIFVLICANERSNSNGDGVGARDEGEHLNSGILPPFFIKSGAVSVVVKGGIFGKILTGLFDTIDINCGSVIILYAQEEVEEHGRFFIEVR